MNVLRLVGAAAEPVDEASVAVGLAGAEGRRHHDVGPLHVGREDIAVVVLPGERGRAGLQGGECRSEQHERIAAEHPGCRTAAGQHQKLAVLAHAPGNVILPGEQAVHAPVVFGEQEVGDVVADEVREAHHLLHIDDGGDAFCRQDGIALHRSHKIIDGGRDAVRLRPRRIAALEDGEDALRSRDILVHLHGIPLSATERQEVGNVLLISLSQSRKRQPRCQHRQQAEEQTPAGAHAVVEAKDKARDHGLAFCENEG